MRAWRFIMPLAPGLIAGCVNAPEKGTLAQLHNVPADVAEVQVEQGLDKAMEGYRRYLHESDGTAMTPEAMRRLADLQIEKAFGVRGDGDLIEMAAPAEIGPGAMSPSQPDSTGIAGLSESDEDFEKRTTQAHEIAPADVSTVAAHPDPAGDDPPTGPLEAIALYDRLLAEYPEFEHNDQVLYQKARAYDELGRSDEAMETMDRLVARYAHSTHYDEVQFRRAEYFFTRRKFRDSESAYEAIVAMGPSSSYYELALYKLGWALYKQEFYDEAQERFVALLDYKVSIGYDFDQTHEEDEERRVADTFRVISLGFSNLGGPETVAEYFAANGARSYEDRIYENLGEFYFAKLRYDDAAKTYEAFVALNPFHRSAPRFSMRVIEIYSRADFPQLVLQSKKDFASRYGLQAEYWQHFDVNETPEVLSYLKTNLRDLASHHHALYQNPELLADQPANFREAQTWYREYLTSFPNDSDTPPISYQLADLLLENEDYGAAALQYETTAYEFPTHERSAKAGYAAVYAYRQDLKKAPEEMQPSIRGRTVASSLRFADTFPDHEHAAAVLGAAADDLYGMKQFHPAINAASKLIEQYPGAEPALMRAAWTVVAHSWFDLSDYPQAEQAYTRLLDLTPGDDPLRVALVDNLAASIYKQGEQASLQQDHRAAADHFMRVKQAAPSSNIRASAEYDAAAALMHLEDWVTAAAVLEAFRNDHPDHELNGEATRQIAFAYRQSGQLDRAATEYERVASESEDTALQGEALLVAGELYEQSNDIPRALSAYGRYVEGFPRPIDTAVETRLKMARMYQAQRDEVRYQEQLREIVRVDAEAGAERTNRTRTVAARSALVLAEQLFAQFEELELRQPFEASLREKKRRMDEAVHALEGLVQYEVGDVTAAATYYMAEIYWGLSQALMDSERPPGMQAGELQEYELALEEEAFPFEERAIDVHEKNMELMRTGLYNAWIDRSLAKLANLVPARYAKGEISSGFMGSIDRYAYSAPVTERPVSPQGGDEQTLEPAEPDGSQAPPPPTDEGPVQTSKHRDRLIVEEVSVAHTN